ncbi:hypothetical protein B0H34DRAFT_781971 [Crassisporium funariophilum]|nr:hypothetical protein B0H34DRAFT_781971 [Crassisporium funariophilum]
MSSRPAYNGSRRKLVLAFDIGTTYSGISYSFLDPGQAPIVKGVTRFPAHEQISGASKIPTIIYYDKEGNVRAVGAEATRDGAFELAEDEGWVKVEWFKLHLRSKFTAMQTIKSQIPALPANKSVVQVFADFLSYLLSCVSAYIQDTHSNGPDMWASVEHDLVYVLSHPNGWEGTEQSQMRKAAVVAGLIPDNVEGHARVSFVTEGEASLHFAVRNGVLSDAMDNGEGVVVVDAGGGTIDVSTYRQTKSNSEKVFEEIAIPQCHFFGSLFVSVHAQLFLKEALADSPFIDDLDHIVRCFDKTAKLRFRNADEPQYVKFGSTRDNDAKHNIRFGQLKLAGTDVAKFFEPSVDCILQSVLELRKTSLHPISHVVLVGGFAASDWLSKIIQHSLTAEGLKVIRPENHVNKAVSDGAISSYLDHFVRTRIAKVTYGHISQLRYKAEDPEHVKRFNTTLKSSAGDLLVDGVFTPILSRNTQVAETQEFRSGFNRSARTKSAQLNAFSTTISCYRGSNLKPKWTDVDAGNYSQVCTINVDIAHVEPTEKVNTAGEKYYSFDYDIVLLFGHTEMKAQIAWFENCRSPTTIVYDPDIALDNP